MTLQRASRSVTPGAVTGRDRTSRNKPGTVTRGFGLTVAPVSALVATMKTLGEKRFVGGKGADGVWQRLVNLCPPHRVLLEAFAGEGVLSRKIRPALETILIDKVKQPGLEVRDWAGTTRFILGDGIAFLKGYKFKGDELVYCDPPYLLTTRGNRAYYEHELTEADHRRLLAVLKNINARVLLSGYRSPLYDRELSEWNRVEFQVMTRGGSKATEVLWFNYPRPGTLHDYAVVGEDTRQRWRLRKKIRRAVNDLCCMPEVERHAMLAAMCAAVSSDGLRSCVPPELASQGPYSQPCAPAAWHATNGAPSSSADPHAGNGAADRIAENGAAISKLKETLAALRTDAATRAAGVPRHNGRASSKPVTPPPEAAPARSL